MAPFDDRFALSLEGTEGLAVLQATLLEPTPTTRISRSASDNTQDWRRHRQRLAGFGDAHRRCKLERRHQQHQPGAGASNWDRRTGTGPVLLFAADAQVGNWLSWQDVKWDYGGRNDQRTGPSRSAPSCTRSAITPATTPRSRKLGLELMTSLELALVPTDAEMARKVKWGTLPWPPLLNGIGRARQRTAWFAPTKPSSPNPPASGKPSIIKVTQEDPLLRGRIRTRSLAALLAASSRAARRWDRCRFPAPPAA